MIDADHDWHMKPTSAPENAFDSSHFCAIALRKMVEACVTLHPIGQSLYTDAERKTMAAAARHIDRLEQELNFASNRIADKDVEIARLNALVGREKQP